MKQKESGFILIDKPVGPSSFGVIARLRKITSLKKIGHAGTLDPFASGLLVCAIGREATREIEKFVKLDKEYVADVVLGKRTDTFDRQGETIFEYSGEKIAKKKIKEVVASFSGKQEQIPPMFSAKKINGKKLYELARQGIEIERQPSKIEIFKIKILKYNWPRLKIRVKCSSGTYVRSLADDIGQKLGCGAYLEELRRTKIGKFDVKKAVKISCLPNKKEKLKNSNWKKYLFS